MRDLSSSTNVPERAGASADALDTVDTTGTVEMRGPPGTPETPEMSERVDVSGAAARSRAVHVSEALRAALAPAPAAVVGPGHRVGRRLLLEVGLAGAVVVGAAVFMRPARAQAAQGASWPSKPVRLVVGFGGGSSPDLVARALAESLSKELGQPVIVDNHTGASGNIAAAIVAKSTDQHTLGILINGNMTTAKLLNPATPYDPQKDLAPINLLCTAPLVLAAPADAPGRGGVEFLAAAREAGDRWSYGSPGMGTIGHLGMELLKTRTGIAPVHVPYQGNPQVVNAMLSGQIHLALLPPGLAQAQVQTGKLRAIGVTSTTRSPLAPLVPPLQELGARDFRLEIWTAVAGPATLPAALVQRLSLLLTGIVHRPEVREKLFQQGYQAAGIPADDFAKRLRQDTAQVRALIDSGAVKVE
ncbi:Bug family tripartite tricarboxylate transporter substrate binding protein [Variovorax sp. LARHSF232]